MVHSPFFRPFSGILMPAMFFVNMKTDFASSREFDTCDGEKVLEVEAEPYFFVNLWRVFIAYLWVLCYNILDSALEVPHETQGV